jgi:hypothetical protein
MHNIVRFNRLAVAIVVATAGAALARIAAQAPARP